MILTTKLREMLKQELQSEFCEGRMAPFDTRVFGMKLRSQTKKLSLSGNRTPVSSVTDWDTEHYTNRDVETRTTI